PDIIAPALQHPSAGVRRNAALVLPRSGSGLDVLLESRILTDQDAQVRLAALLALTEMPSSESAGRVLATLMNDPSNSTDRWIPDAATSTAAKHDPIFLKAMAENRNASATRAAESVRIMSEHYARGGPIGSVQRILLALAKGYPRNAEIVL